MVAARQALKGTLDHWESSMHWVLKDTEWRITVTAHCSMNMTESVTQVPRVQRLGIMMLTISFKKD